jgi:ArsR family transcriptional regulator, cadmium/lead-responsive transcriptional repressor
MNVLPDLNTATTGIPRPTGPSSACDLHCKEELFHSLADRSRLCILDTLCNGAKTVAQIAAATGLSQLDVSIQLERLLHCGCVTPKRTAHSVLYALSAPRLLQLEAVVDELLVTSLKAPRVSNYD